MFKKIILNLGLCAVAIASQAQALLPTFWNFSTPSISAPPTGWTLGLGTNGSLTYAGGANSVGGDNTAARLDATNEFITIWVADKPGQVSYWIKGTGITPPPFNGSFKIQESIDGTSWNDLRVFTTANLTGTMTRYTDNPALTSRYIRFFYADKQAGSNVSLDSVIIKTAPPATTPTLEVSRDNKTIANNTQNIVGKSANFSFKVKNLGLIDTLVIDSAKFTGLNSGSFGISGTVFPIKIPANDSAFISCTLDTFGSGSRFAAINIYNNDLDKKQFVVNLYGIAGNLATEPSFKSTNISFTNVTAYGMTVTISDTNSTTENYVVLRKKNGAITEVPVDGVTYQRGDYIGDAQVAYVGKVGTFKPAYILANNNYSFAVFSFNGPATYENYLTSSPNKASVQSLAGNPGTYYSNIDTLSSSFLTSLSAKINVHDTIFYSNYITTVINNFLTRDTTFGKKVVNCVYTGIPYIYSEPFVWNASGSTGILTREHTRAQSTMPSNNAAQNPNWPNAGATTKELPEYNDQHNLFPAHQTLANAPRSNNPFGECVTVTSTSPSGYGKLGKDANGNTVYEPKDTQKGDLARALFYMSVSYNGINGNVWTLPADQGLAVLLKWHQQDPPSDEEIARHEYIASVQKNRNPFIDNPSWANLIDFKTMTLIQNKVLAVSSPNGGENLVAGKSTNITWLAANISGKVKLEYTTNGTDFIFIDSVNASTATYTWTVPAIATTTAKIKITTLDNANSDLSNANFTINIPTLKLLTPVANDIWKETEVKTITWQSTFVDSVSIKLIINGVTELWKKKELASKGSHTLTVPFANTSNAKIFINEIGGNLKDSSATFTIQPSIGVNEVSNANFNIYPNPSNGTIFFTTDLNLQHASFEILDVTGKLIIKDELSKTNSIAIPSKGIFVLKAMIDGKSIIRKIVVE